MSWPAKADYIERSVFGMEVDPTHRAGRVEGGNNPRPQRGSVIETADNHVIFRGEHPGEDRLR